MKRLALINGDGTVVNIIVADESYRPRAEYRAVESDAASIGDTWDGSTFKSPPVSADVTRGGIEMICSNNILAALGNKSASMDRESTFLLGLQAAGKTLTDAQKSERAMFDAINAWETAMIDKREALIASGDLAAAARQETWPPPPDGLDEFLKGF